MIPNIYLSVPVTIDWAEVLKVYKRVEDTGYPVKVNAWIRKMAYNNLMISDCDIFAFMTPKNDWKFNVNTLPSGVQRELNKAISLDKEIYMIYQNQDGQYNFYKIDYSCNVIQGISGTSAFIWKALEGTVNGKTSANTTPNRYVVIAIDKSQARLKLVTPSECVDYDPRLLL